MSECERRGIREGRGSGGSMRGSWRGSSLLPEWRGEERERDDDVAMDVYRHLGGFVCFLSVFVSERERECV